MMEMCTNEILISMMMMIDRLSDDIMGSSSSTQRGFEQA
jgi:hypothetical protein